MQSTAKDVTAYLGKSLPSERPLSKKCLATLKGFEESMMYSGPVYSRNGIAEVGFASQKHFIGLYILRTDVMNAHRDVLNIKGASVGKGSIRYSKPEKIDFDVVKSMLKATVLSTGEAC